MNLKEIKTRMDKRRTYKWAVSPLGVYHLFGTTGRTVVMAYSRYEAERLDRALRGAKMQIINEVPGKVGSGQ